MVVQSDGAAPLATRCADGEHEVRSGVLRCAAVLVTHTSGARR
jgi:hypothetical protein